MPRYEIRAAGPADEEELLDLAHHLNTVNLPSDRRHVRDLLELSRASFSGELADEARRRYVFLLWDTEKKRAAGSSSVIAQLGRRDAPYIYFDVIREEKYSRSVDRHFEHTLLRLGFSYNGPTELGALVVRPEYRGAPERLGRLISYVRFLFIAARRRQFKDQLLAELLPPLEPDGTSHLWEALGRRFTGMSYAEADLLSSENKDFIGDLFPASAIYATLLSSEAHAVIGQVGDQTRGVEKMLRRVGFEYARRIDPFDGGPHFVAATDAVSLVQRARLARYAPDAAAHAAVSALIAREEAREPYFVCACAPAWCDGDRFRIEPPVAEQLGLRPDTEVWLLPLKADPPV